MRRLFLALPAAFASALLAASAAAGANGLSPVTPDSPNARAIRQTYWIILGVAGTYRQNDSVDLVYEVDGRRAVETGLPILAP